jgi:hypothetical protein
MAEFPTENSAIGVLHSRPLCGILGLMRRIA